MRLFAALELPEHVRDALDVWWSEAYRMFDESYWRPVSPHLWHVTLAFYGEVSGRDSDDLAECLAQCAALAPSLNLTLNGSGVFPKPTRPSVYWVGVDESGDKEGFVHLARCCRRAGHATVRRLSVREAPFRGHVTLARFRGCHQAWVERPWERLPKLPEMDWTLGEFGLFQSILGPQGPQYRKLETFKCKALGRTMVSEEI